MILHKRGVYKAIWNSIPLNEVVSVIWQDYGLSEIFNLFSGSSRMHSDCTSDTTELGD